VVHACNPSTREVEAGAHKFKASLGYIAGHCLKKTKRVCDKMGKRENQNKGKHRRDRGKKSPEGGQ
jgi:hypothetical protein